MTRAIAQYHSTSRADVLQYIYILHIVLGKSPKREKNCFLESGREANFCLKSGRVGSSEVGLFVFDEFHCIRVWGDDIPPLYKDVFYLRATALKIPI